MGQPRKDRVVKQGQGGGFYWCLYSTGRLSIYKRQGWRFYHTIVLERKIGRRLSPGENTHHINGNTLDNRPENLECLTAKEHGRLHSKKKATETGLSEHRSV